MASTDVIPAIVALPRSDATSLRYALLNASIPSLAWWASPSVSAPWAAASADARVGLTCPERTAAHREACVERRRRAAGEELDHSRHGIAPVQDTRRPPHDLDALQVVGGDGAKVDRTSRVVHRNAVDEDLHVVALPTADEERALRP